MQEEQVDQQAEATEEPDAGAEDSSGDTGDSELAAAAAVDEQAAQSSGTAAEAEPEVPDDASAKIQAAQAHIDNLNMDEEREAAKKAT